MQDDILAGIGCDPVAELAQLALDEACPYAVRVQALKALAPLHHKAQGARMQDVQIIIDTGVSRAPKD
jgi:hypothetical protein